MNIYRYTRHFAIFTAVLLIFPNFVQAQDNIRNFSVANPTVKVYSYQHTKNNQVVARSTGSATIIREDGLLLTNNHVVQKDEDDRHDAFQVCITFLEGKKPACDYTASFVARDEDLDLALLQIDREDIYGNTLPEFNFIPYNNSKTYQAEDTISVLGYPDIGGESLTVTQGQISGFEEINNINYIKTDTDISSGNSGGTAIDSEGNLVGVPTYVISSIDNLGYILGMDYASPWIDKNASTLPEYDAELRNLVVEYAKRINSAKNDKLYNHPYYPQFSLQLPTDWKFDTLQRNIISMSTQKKNKTYALSMNLREFPFEVTEKYLDEAIFQKIEKNKDFFQNYQRKNIEFKNLPAYSLEYDNTYGDTKSINYVIPYGSVVVVISYNLDLKALEDDTKVYEDILRSLTFKDSPQVLDEVQTLTRTTPPFSISTTENWFLQENKLANLENTIVEFLREDSVESKISIRHFERTQADKNLSAEQYLKDKLRSKEFISNFRLVSTNQNVVIDGLEGVSLTYNYQGEELNQTRKVSEIYLFDNDDYYFITYDDLDTQYDLYIEDFKNILRSFQNNNVETQQNKGTYLLGSLNYVFFDISYHRFEQSIAKLKDLEIIEGYADETFKPEKNVSRAEALKIILLSKQVIDEKEGNFDLANELEIIRTNEFSDLDFVDTARVKWMAPFIRYAKKYEVVNGVNQDSFQPFAHVTVAEALKMILNLYEIPTWEIPESQNNLVPWSKPYMDKGFELGLIPVGIYDANHRLTRGELAYIVDRLMDKRD